MSGQGGTKHRMRSLKQKRNQRKGKARQDVARVRGLFEGKGQPWDPLNNAQQMAALNHDGRRQVQASSRTRL
jgi:hypothetical protein